MSGYNYQRYPRQQSNSFDTNDNASRYNYNSYIDGNVARQYHTYSQPDEDKEWLREIYRDRERENAREERARQSRVRRLEHSRSMSFASFAVLAVAVLVMLYLCVGYIQAKSAVTSLNKEIVTTETEYNELKAKNDSNQKEIESSVNLQKIYNIATKDLGMVFANDNQIITYDNNESAYVRQYNDIQDEYGDNILDDIANVVK